MKLLVMHLSSFRYYSVSASSFGLLQPYTKQTSLRSVQGALGSATLVSHHLIYFPNEGRMEQSESEFFSICIFFYLPHCLLPRGCERGVYLTCQNKFLVPSQHQLILRKTDLGENIVTSRKPTFSKTLDIYLGCFRFSLV